jgi:hypothetical protein
MLTIHQPSRHTLYLIIQLTLLVLPYDAYSWVALTETLDLRCEQSQLKSLDCNYRMLVPEPPLAVSALIANEKLTVTEKETYPWPQAVTAILFLIDNLSSLLDVTKDYQHLGLASFDKSLRIEAPIGTSKNQILEAAQHLSAVGKTTELYRNVIKAISLLHSIKADRKTIFLFSDGLAEDKAYFHQDVINTARSANVIINTLGYPRSISQSVALQTLRRLSEETGGVYIETDNHFNLPSGFLNQPYENIDNGGVININLTPAIESGMTGAADLQLTFETDFGDIQLKIPVKLPPSASKQETRSSIPVPEVPTKTPTQIITKPPVVTTPIQVVTKQSQTKAIDLWLWYGVPAALLILIIMVLLTMVLIWQRQGARKSTSDSSREYKPYAYLVTQDEAATRYPITRTIWRIGRSKDNELTLRDNSVSRRHAEIHRKFNGKFDIVDIESVNGVYVNDKKISKADLSEGDLLEIGDIIMQFTQYPSDYLQEDSTEIQKTKAPVTQ